MKHNLTKYVQNGTTPKIDAIWQCKTIIHAIKWLWYDYRTYHVAQCNKIHAMQYNTTKIYTVKSNKTQIHAIWLNATQYYTRQILAIKYNTNK